MSKYDQLNYLTLSEKNGKGLPNCITDLENEEPIIPDELYGINVQNLKNYFDIKNDEDESKFNFINNSQTVINENYFKNCKIFSDKMDKDEKREFLLDYMNYHFGNHVDGEYFKNFLQDMFDLRKYELEAEDFDVMIFDYFKKRNVDLNNPEDRKLFKAIMFYQHIKFLNKEKADNYIKKAIEDISEENESKGSNISN